MGAVATRYFHAIQTDIYQNQTMESVPTTFFLILTFSPQKTSATNLASLNNLDITQFINFIGKRRYVNKYKPNVELHTHTF
jgi:hypothetical protein